MGRNRVKESKPSRQRHHREHPIQGRGLTYRAQGVRPSNDTMTPLPARRCAKVLLPKTKECEERDLLYSPREAEAVSFLLRLARQTSTHQDNLLPPLALLLPTTTVRPRRRAVTLSAHRSRPVPDPAISLSIINDRPSSRFRQRGAHPRAAIRFRVGCGEGGEFEAVRSSRDGDGAARTAGESGRGPVHRRRRRDRSDTTDRS